MKFTAIIVLILLLFSCTKIEKKNIVEVLSVYDGDTITISLESMSGDEIRALLGNKWSVRIAGIDTAEINGACTFEKEIAKKARDLLREKIENKKSVELIELDGIGKKYKRIIADVVIDGEKVSDIMLQNQYASVYGEEKDWCANE